MAEAPIALVELTPPEQFIGNSPLRAVTPVSYISEAVFSSNNPNLSNIHKVVFDVVIRNVNEWLGTVTEKYGVKANGFNLQLDIDS